MRILGVNAAGQEAGNALMCDGRTLPWLQDTQAADVKTPATVFSVVNPITPRMLDGRLCATE